MKQYLVDAFTDRVFGGNPAAVCILDHWVSEWLMERIAGENNLSETAFAVKEGGGYRLRWFTPAGEIDFCGHATLGTAYVLKRFLEPDRETFRFHTLSGELTVHAEGEAFLMDFPQYELRPAAVTGQMAAAIGVRPVAAYLDRDLLLVLDSEEAVISLRPDRRRMGALEGLSIAVTARGREYDCVSRVFTPELDALEDPVTGSTHCMIVPYWAEKLGKSRITALQASPRAGVLHGEVRGGRVLLSGKAVLFGIGEILPDGLPR